VIERKNMRQMIVALAMVAAGMLAGGCVERRMLIRSDPSGAPVWIDEEAAGITPAEAPFKHYGRRRVRVGPVRDEKGHMIYEASEAMAEVLPPWYQKFPVDFFVEVLYPFTVVDTQEFTFELKPAVEESDEDVITHAEDIIEEAEEFRKESLDTLPEQ
jgi:hypothetical protein